MEGCRGWHVFNPGGSGRGTSPATVTIDAGLSGSNGDGSGGDSAEADDDAAHGDSGLSGPDPGQPDG